jgi:hypothetical protein
VEAKRDKELSLSHSAPEVVSTGDAQRCRSSPLFLHSSTPTPATPISLPSGGQIAHSHVLGVSALRSVPGARTTSGQAGNAPGAQAVGAPVTPSHRRGCPIANERCHMGSSPLFCDASHVRLTASPGSWASISVPATAGAGSCAMPCGPLTWIASWRARAQRMNALTPRGTRGQRHAVGQSPWDTGRGVDARSASLAEATMPKIGRRASRG